jgi:hypothetical protein
MKRRIRYLSILATVAWAAWCVAALEGCRPDPFKNLGTSYPCAASNGPVYSCVVGQSYCEISGGYGGGSGFVQTPSCIPISPGSDCAIAPSCGCICASRGLSCDTVFPCTCHDQGGFATLTCNSI